MSSKRKAIKDAAITALQTITLANGYNYTVSGVGKLVLNKLDDRHIIQGKPYIVIIFPSEPRERMPSRLTRAVINFSVIGYIFTPTMGDDIDIQKENLIEDVEKALMADLTLGGVCVELLIDEVSSCDGILAPHYFVQLDGRIIYHYTGIAV